MRVRATLIAAALLGCAPERIPPERSADGRLLVHPNDNRTPGGVWRGDTLVVDLTAVLAAWHPDERADSMLTVQAFADADGRPHVPGPLVRVPAGTLVEYRIRNEIPDSLLVMHALHGISREADTVHVPSGTTRVVRIRRHTPGTWHYWGTTTGDRLEPSELRDGPLAGGLIIDPTGLTPDPDERIWVLTTVDILPDTSTPGPPDDVFDLAINERSWPSTERLVYAVGDSVRWRVINATATGHPMHLHGFHFTVTSKSDGVTDDVFPPELQYEAVTEFLDPGTSARLTWTPTRAGQWLFHCHMIPHIVPFPIRPDSVRLGSAPASHDMQAATHMRDGMSGLVLGITVRDTNPMSVQRAAGVRAPFDPSAITKRLRLFAQESPQPVSPHDDTTRRRGYVLDRGGDPARDSVEIAGPVLVLTRDEPTAITVHNRLSEPTSVHWHGMELESYYDGVAGWSGTEARRAPLLQPGDSFVALMRPPRSGTFMYHPHMDEEDQLTAGMFGALLVLDPGERFDPETDLVFMLGAAPLDSVRALTINGTRKPPGLTFRRGTRYRLRFLNMQAAGSVSIKLGRDEGIQLLTPHAIDGADLPPMRRVPRRADFGLGVGETIDFMWTPDTAGRFVLSFEDRDERRPIEQQLIVR